MSIITAVPTTRRLGDLGFVTAATALCASVAAVGPGWTQGPLVVEQFGEIGRIAYLAWQGTVAMGALVLPLTVLVRGGSPSARKALSAYVLVLLAQIALESTLVLTQAPNTVIAAGMLFTGYRLVVLRNMWPTVRDDAAAQAVVRTGLLLWCINLGYLVCIALPVALSAR